MRLALPLVLASQLAAPTSLPAGRTGNLIGRILAPSDDTAPAKALWIGRVSTPVAPDGSFRLDGVPAGPARLAVETADGLYAVEAPVIVAPGSTRTLHIALGGREDTSPPPPAEKEKKKKKSFWANPTSATFIIIGSAIVLGVVVDQLVKPNESNPVSPSAPSN